MNYCPYLIKITEELASRGFTKEMVIESSLEDFNSMLENDQDITHEERDMLKDLRRKGKNRLAAAKSRQHQLAQSVNYSVPIPGMVII